MDLCKVGDALSATVTSILGHRRGILVSHNGRKATDGLHALGQRGDVRVLDLGYVALLADVLLDLFPVWPHDDTMRARRHVKEDDVALALDLLILRKCWGC